MSDHPFPGTADLPERPRILTAGTTAMPGVLPPSDHGAGGLASTLREAAHRPATARRSEDDIARIQTSRRHQEPGLDQTGQATRHRPRLGARSRGDLQVGVIARRLPQPPGLPAVAAREVCADVHGSWPLTCRAALEDVDRADRLRSERPGTACEPLRGRPLGAARTRHRRRFPRLPAGDLERRLIGGGRRDGPAPRHDRRRPGARDVPSRRRPGPRASCADRTGLSPSRAAQLADRQTLAATMPGFRRPVRDVSRHGRAGNAAPFPWSAEPAR